MKKNESNQKLGINKFQIAQIKNLSKIIGGDDDDIVTHPTRPKTIKTIKTSQKDLIN